MMVKVPGYCSMLCPLAEHFTDTAAFNVVLTLPTVRNGATFR